MKQMCEKERMSGSIGQITRHEEGRAICIQWHSKQVSTTGDNLSWLLWEIGIKTLTISNKCIGNADLDLTKKQSDKCDWYNRFKTMTRLNHTFYSHFCTSSAIFRIRHTYGNSEDNCIWVNRGREHCFVSVGVEIIGMWTRVGPGIGITSCQRTGVTKDWQRMIMDKQVMINIKQSPNHSHVRVLREKRILKDWNSEWKLQDDEISRNNAWEEVEK